MSLFAFTQTFSKYRDLLQMMVLLKVVLVCYDMNFSLHFLYSVTEESQRHTL